MLDIVRTDSSNPDFIQLVQLLDADLAFRDGAEHSFYAQFNKIDNIKNVVLAFEEGHAVGCGAIKQFNPRTMEVKRMYVVTEKRGRGIAGKILTELEHWAVELRYETCILETGRKQPEAIALYTRCGYNRTSNYGQYAGVENSVCFEKQLRGHHT
jgi:GNAT superfamily N-acetyltransferase